MLDAKGRWTSSRAPGRAPLSATYHPTGEIDTVTKGTGEDARVTTWSYDALHRVESITDPADKTVTFGRDDANRVTSITLADGQVVGFGLDDEGKLETLTPPGRPAHRFTYTPTDLPRTHVLPDVGPTGHRPRNRARRQDSRPVRSGSVGRTLAPSSASSR